MGAIPQGCKKLPQVVLKGRIPRVVPEVIVLVFMDT